MNFNKIDLEMQLKQKNFLINFHDILSKKIDLLSGITSKIGLSSLNEINLSPLSSSLSFKKDSSRNLSHFSFNS